MPRQKKKQNKNQDTSLPFNKDKNMLVLDVETQYLSSEIDGGWSSIDKFKVSVAVSWDLKNGFRVWTENLALELIEEASNYAPIITFNGEGFDFKVLSAYGDVSQLYLNSFDLLSILKAKLKYRVHLDSVASATLNVNKSADGLQAVEWWRSGDVELRKRVVEYCADDVSITRDIYLFLKKNGYLLINDYSTGCTKKVEICV